MNIVGYKSPFKKKNSPMKAIDPATAQVVAAVAPAVISGISSLFGRRKRRRERARARAEMKKARRAFEAIEFTNPFANLQNPYTCLLYTSPSPRDS